MKTGQAPCPGLGEEEPDGCSMEQLMMQLKNLDADIAAIGVGTATEAPTEALLQRGGKGGNAVVWYEIHSEDEGEDNEPDRAAGSAPGNGILGKCKPGTANMQELGCQQLFADRGMQTDWSCEPGTNCLVATTAEQAMNLAGWWESAGMSKDDDCSASPDVPTYNALISACEKGHKVEKAMELFDEMQLRGLEPKVITGTAVNSACAKATR